MDRNTEIKERINEPVCQELDMKGRLDSIGDKLMNAITLNQSNHFVLRKQHLTDETRSDDIIQTVRDMGGLHATSPKTPYLSLFSRVNNFTKEKLYEELYVKRSLGKIRCMRKTVYIVPKEIISVAFAATRKMAEPASEQYSKFLGISHKQYKETSSQIKRILKGRGMTTKEIKEKLQATLNVSPIVNLMCDKGLLIRGNPQGGWKSNIHTYYLFHEYFPDVDLNVLDEGSARKLLVKLYLASFGPATENDAAWWTGFPKGQTKRIVKSLQDKVSHVEIMETKADHILLSSDRKSLMSTKPPKKPVINILPGLDPYLMGYKNRDRYLDLNHYNFVFDRSGNATSTILLDGRVVGVWDFEEPFMKIFLFKDVKAIILKEIHSIAKDVGPFLSGKEVQIKECDSMIPLPQRTAGGVMSPLKNC